MPTNPKGYTSRYYRRERMKIILFLGGACQCGSTDNLQIHHTDRWRGKRVRGRGRMERLADWKRCLRENPASLKVACPKHHGELYHAKASC